MRTSHMFICTLAWLIAVAVISYSSSASSQGLVAGTGTAVCWESDDVHRDVILICKIELTTHEIPPDNVTMTFTLPTPLSYAGGPDERKKLAPVEMEQLPMFFNYNPDDLSEEELAFDLFLAFVFFGCIILYLERNRK